MGMMCVYVCGRVGFIEKFVGGRKDRIDYADKIVRTQTWKINIYYTSAIQALLKHMRKTIYFLKVLKR